MKEMQNIFVCIEEGNTLRLSACIKLSYEVYSS